MNKAGAKLCKATGDPHFTTFDGLYFHMYHVGDYYMMGTFGSRTEVTWHEWKNINNELS